jgi:hypothetical protein
VDDAIQALHRLDESSEPTPREIETVLETYERAGRSDRKQMRISASPCQRQRHLGAYAGAKGNQALRTGLERDVVLGLLALSLHDFACDFRDDYFALAVLFHAADRRGLKRLRIAKRVGSLSSREGARHILRFAKLPDEKRALSELLLHEFDTPDGPEVRGVPPGWAPDQPVPTKGWAKGLIDRLLAKWGMSGG